MSCCRRVKPAESEKKIIQAVKNSESQRNFGGSKSNRSAPGTIARQCGQCGTKTAVSICPVCSTPIR